MAGERNPYVLASLKNCRVRTETDAKIPVVAPPAGSDVYMMARLWNFWPIKVLEKAGLITREKDAQWRRCRIEAARLKEANEFIEKYRKFWEDSFDRLEIYLKKLQGKEGESNERKK